MRLDPAQFREAYHNDAKARAELQTQNLAHLGRIMKMLPPDAIGLEIGCNAGGSTVWFLENGLARISVIDCFTGSPEHTKEQREGLEEKFYQNTKDFLPRIDTVFKGRSDEGLAAMFTYASNVGPARADRTGMVRQPFDLIYVDGSHDSRDVILDLCLAWRLLRHGGILVADDLEWAFHDHKFRNPKPAIEFFVDCHREELEILERNYQLSIRKKEII